MGARRAPVPTAPSSPSRCPAGRADGRRHRRRAALRRRRRTGRRRGWLGDETQDPDGGGLGLDWEDDWFEDFEEGDEFDDDFEADDSAAARRRLRVLNAERLPGGGASLLLGVPRRGHLSAAVTLPANRRTGAGPFLTIPGAKGVKRPGRVRLRLASTPGGTRVLSRRKRVGRRSSRPSSTGTAA